MDGSNLGQLWLEAAAACLGRKPKERRPPGRSLGSLLHFRPAGVQDRLGVAVRLLAALEDEIAGRLEGDAPSKSGAIGR